VSSLPRLSRPTREQVEARVGRTWLNVADVPAPGRTADEWGRSHREFVLGVVLPSISPPLRVWRLAAEAYLCDVLAPDGGIVPFEVAACDGSSVVPDVAYPWGNIKDPWGVMHDYAYAMNRRGLLDAYGHRWGKLEADGAYRDGFIASGRPVVGWIWWGGLVVGGVGAWRGIKRASRPLIGSPSHRFP
jgi:hypothetical protein